MMDAQELRRGFQNEFEKFKDRCKPRSVWVMRREGLVRNQNLQKILQRSS